MSGVTNYCIGPIDIGDHLLTYLQFDVIHSASIYFFARLSLCAKRVMNFRV